MVKASRTGGSRKVILLPVSGLLDAEEARGILSSVLVALLQGSLDATTAKAAAYIIQVDRRLVEGEVLEKRMAALEGFVSQINGKVTWPR